MATTFSCFLKFFLCRKLSCLSCTNRTKIRRRPHFSLSRGSDLNFCRTLSWLLNEIIDSHKSRGLQLYILMSFRASSSIEFSIYFRFLSSAEISSSIIGSNYTFFVPNDDAFEKYGFDLLPDEALSSEKGIKLVLNHFVKGRLYDRDLKHDEVFETVGGKPLKITRDSNGQVSVNRAKIVESENFVYNLGTMFFIDDVLYPETLKNEVKTITQSPSLNKKRENESSEEFFTTEMSIFSESEEKLSTKSHREPTTSEYRSMLSALLTTRADVELVPSEFSEFAEEFSVSDSQVTPKALPLNSKYSSTVPRK